MIRLLTLATLALLLWPSVVGADSYVWGSETREQLLWSNLFQSASTSMSTNWAGAVCLLPNDSLDADSAVACNDTETTMAFTRPVTITKLAFASAVAMVTDDGCSIRLTDDFGVTGLATSQLDIPLTDADSAIGDVFATTGTAVSLAAGQGFQIQVADGDHCTAGTACQCDAGHVAGTLEIWGIIH